MAPSLVIRRLEEADAEAYQALWLRALAEHPEAYGISYEEQAAIGMAQIRETIRLTSPEHCIFGAFQAGELVGLARFYRHPRTKSHHKAYLGSMYVKAELRGQGVGRRLITAAIEHAHSLRGVEELVLAVTIGNDAARNLYLSMGFTPYALEPAYIKVGERYYDIEWLRRGVGE
jgi:ribosomal protein S18 acetylase RimI-like enzyme